MLTDDPAKLKAVLEQLQTEWQRRIDERVEKGEAVLVPPVVVGVVGSINAEKARMIAELRAAGETREVIFGFKPADGSDAIEAIVTGVPRRGRDDGVDIPATGGRQYLRSAKAPAVPRYQRTRNADESVGG